MKKYLIALGLVLIGYVIGPLSLLFGSVLFYAGFHDWRKHEVPDVLTSALWVLAVLGVITGSIDPLVILVTFTGLYTINIWCAMITLKPAMGWADVLALPPWFGFMLSYGWPGVLAAGMSLFLFDYQHRRNGGPLLPFLMAAYVSVVCASVLLHVPS